MRVKRGIADITCTLPFFLSERIRMHRREHPQIRALWPPHQWMTQLMLHSRTGYREFIFGQGMEDEQYLGAIEAG